MLTPRRKAAMMTLTLALFLAVPAMDQRIESPRRNSTARQVTTLTPTSAAVDDVVVTIDQIAKLTGGSDALRNRIGKLDIAELKIGEDYRVVTTEQVRFRLLLADLNPAQFQFSGARRAMIIESDEPITARKLIAAAQRAVRAKYPGDVSRLTITPAKGLLVPEVDAASDARIRFEADSLKWSASSLGRVRVDVAVVVDGKTRVVAPVHLDLAESAPSFQPNTEKSSGIRPVANWTPAVADAPKDFLIKARDNVKLVTPLGSARIEATGEAQQDGKVGQVIRVRNSDSNRIVHGRVDASGSVIVEP